MVKVGLIGAETLLAGEIIRILTNHPDTEIVSLYAPSVLGHNISTVHHGMIGEPSLFFSDKINPEEIDFLIIADKTEVGDKIISQLLNWDHLKVAVLENLINPSLENFEIGLSEINRKALVRGAKYAFIPSTAFVPASIALFPLAHYLILNSDINIEVVLPADVSESLEENREASYLEALLKKYQVSFNGEVKLIIQSDHQNERGASTRIIFKNSLPLTEIENIYNSIYDDHNFTYITRNPISPKEVEGTQKVILQLTKPQPDILEINIVSDARMRGAAGDIVHIMNLFFGLHEKTGLRLKPSRYI